MTKQNEKLFNELEETLKELDNAINDTTDYNKRMTIYTKRYVIMQVQRLLLGADYKTISDEIVNY